MSALVFYRDNDEQMRISLDRPQLSLGRGPQNDVAVPDAAVSRQQAIVERRGAKVFLKDASGRGTPVDGAPHIEIELRDGAEIRLGDWKAIYQVHADVSATQTQGGARNDDTELMDAHEARSSAGPVQLRVRDRNGRRALPFPGDELTIGKDPSNSLVVDDRFVSGFHARLVRTGRGFWLRDLGSTNGTFVNGSRIKEGEVASGSLIRVGETEIGLEPVPGARESATDGFEGLVGRDPSMLQLFELIDRVAPSGVAVTIFGETGTGKELVAHAIHHRSQRRDRPFVPVNCAAITKELIESELFGHEKGAFTGADRARTGAFEEANGGTLFLDEIGELSTDLQAKLLRALESGEIRRVGSSKPVHVDVRIVAATHQDLLAMARRNQFREDLYYRLCVFPLTLPPLRRRLNDLAPLTDFFVRKFAPSGLPVKLSQPARQKLASHPFTGNIRELRNVVHRALLLRRGANIEDNDIVFDAPYSEQATAASVATAAPAGQRLDDDNHLYLPGRSMEEAEQEIIVRCVRRNAGVKSLAAKELQISRSTVIKRTGGGEGE